MKLPASFWNRYSLSLAAAASLLCPRANAADYPTTILGDKPVAYYRLEELPGATVAVDSSSNALNGTYNFNSTGSPLLGLPGIDTNSISFSYGSGASDFGYVSIPYNILLSPVNSDGLTGAPFSAECWVEATTLTLSDYISPVAMSGAYTGGTYANGSGWNFYEAATTPPTWQLFIRTKAGVEILADPTPIALLQWYHLAVTWDGTNAIFYVNAAPQQTLALNNYLAVPNYAAAIGAGPQTGHGAFVGGVDEVAFYTNALTATQITNHYKIGTNSFRSPPTPPGFVTAPQSSTNYSGTSVTFSALANGTAPLHYQWFRNGSVLSSQTNSAYSFIAQYPADNGASFTVTVTNALGSTNNSSAPAVLTVLTNLNILAPPFSITRNSNSYAAFRVAASGAQPIGYKWSVSTNSGNSYTALAGQTNGTLWLTNVPLSWNGYQYGVTVTNPFGSSFAFATLTVQPRAVNVSFDAYGKVVTNDHPVAFWLLDEATNSTTATDAVGSFDGTYNNNLGPIRWGISGGIPNATNPVIDLADTNETLAGQGGVVDIPYALELNPYGAWTFEAWVRPDSNDPVGNYRTIFSSMYNSNFSTAVFGWLIYQHPASAFTLVAFNGTGGPAFFGSDFGHIPLNPGSWYHLALVDNTTNIQLYVNGVAGSANTSVAGSGFIPDGINGDPSLSAGPTVLGQRSDGAFYGFSGGVGNVAVYNYALTQAQVTSHFHGAVALSFALSGTNVVLTWPFGTLQASGNVNGTYTNVTGAASPFTTATGGSHAFFRVREQ